MALGVWALGLAAVWIGLLFVVAWWVDRGHGRRRTSPVVYTLSLAVYCTSWTFFGSVGLAADSGLGFLPIYLGPTLVAVLFPLFLPRFVAVCQRHRVSSVPDLLAARFGKSAGLAALATLVAVVGVVPYIALQLRAVDLSFRLLTGVPEGSLAWWADTSLLTAVVMAVFAMIFGTRSLQATEQHHGMVRAIALESLLKLLALGVVAGFVWVVVFRGMDGFREALAQQPTDWLTVATPDRAYGDWLVLLLLSMSAMVFLPRQFHMLVVENDNPDHARAAAWMFPLYLLLINIPVIPIALAGRMFLGGDVPADTWVLALPLLFDAQMVALVAFLGGLSAATGMIIVECIALATMVSNDLALPLLLRARAAGLMPMELGQRLLRVRRGSMVVVLLLGYAYLSAVGDQRSLVSMGLVSFAAVALFAPGVVLGLIWRQLSGRAVGLGLAVGFAVWLHTLFLPSVWPAYSDGWGPLLRPDALFGFGGWGALTHGVFWSVGLNLLTVVLFSLRDRRRAAEVAQAEDFVRSMRGSVDDPTPSLWRGGVAIDDLERLLTHVLGAEKTQALLVRTGPQLQADGEMLRAVESELAAAVGSASARILVSSVATAHEMSQEEVFRLMAETSGALQMARQLQQKSDALERATRDLRAANLRLRELDKLKDDFVSTVTHELRTPLTSIRAFTEIMRDDAELDAEERSRFLRIVMDETDRLSRLIEQVLDLSKLESGEAQWQHEPVDLHAAIQRACGVLRGLADQRGVLLEPDLRAAQCTVIADRDRVQQLLVNLLANAIKFCPESKGRVRIATRVHRGALVVTVADNGPGIPQDEQQRIFERFRQARRRDQKVSGTGLGLAISKRIVDHLGGRIGVRSRLGRGAQFSFTLPLQPPETT